MCAICVWVSIRAMRINNRVALCLNSQYNTQTLTRKSIQKHAMCRCKMHTGARNWAPCRVKCVVVPATYSRIHYDVVTVVVIVHLYIHKHTQTNRRTYFITLARACVLDWCGNRKHTMPPPQKRVCKRVQSVAFMRCVCV